MAERKFAVPEGVQAPAASYMEPPPTAEEIAAASRPATMTLDRRGGSPQFQSMPAAPQSPGAVAIPPYPYTDASQYTDAPVPSPAPAGYAPGGDLPTGAPAPAESPFTDYASVNPESRYDKDIEFTHTLSRMLGMAGLGDKASAARELHMKLQGARMDDIGAQAQRAFAAGDITKGIDMFNHAVPNDVKILAYRENKDGTITFKTAKGEETRSKASLADAITTYRNPELLHEMMKIKAKSAYDMQNDMAVAGYKGQLSMQEAVMKGMISRQSAQELERMKLSGAAPHVFQQIGGETYMTRSTPNGGETYKEVTAKDLNDKLIKKWVLAELPGAASSGYQVNPALMPKGL